METIQIVLDRNFSGKTIGLRALQNSLDQHSFAMTSALIFIEWKLAL
jgi:hypothetical protein